jgi:hypothetical protein
MGQGFIIQAVHVESWNEPEKHCSCGHLRPVLIRTPDRLYARSDRPR